MSIIDSLEVVEFGFIPVDQVPEDANILKSHVIPFVIVGVVRNLVIMNVLTLSPGTSDLDKLFLISLARSGSLILVLSWNPTSVNNDGGSIKLDEVFSLSDTLKGSMTTFVTVKRIDNFESLNSLSIDDSFSGNEDLLGEVKLTNDEVRSKSMVYSPFFIGHTPPGEEHLLPGSAVSRLQRESVVGFRTVEFLLDVLSVVEVTDETCKAEGIDSTVQDSTTLLTTHALE
mmetsp:Transcript_115393/g.160183  ORF Transcript_115393/g.160183 Transcript_115393/m.160183 type:complete len:229 (-) Transcript_115393:36-722(-)